ncbi:MAG TPA: sigma-70 family RNA polymerase sigma factor [Vicinamibacterales bacterium]
MTPDLIPETIESKLPATEPPRAPAPPGTIESIYLEHAPLLRRVAIRKFGIPNADAETLVHDVFAAYIANPGAVRANLRAYLIAAICNASRNYWRSHHLHERFFAGRDEHEETDTVPDETFFEGLFLHLVIAATLARLGDRCREILRRYYIEGEDSGSIALSLETSPGNVNYLMHGCRKKARRVYEELTKIP